MGVGASTGVGAGVGAGAGAGAGVGTGTAVVTSVLHTGHLWWSSNHCSRHSILTYLPQQGIFRAISFSSTGSWQIGQSPTSAGAFATGASLVISRPKTPLPRVVLPCSDLFRTRCKTGSSLLASLPEMLLSLMLIWPSSLASLSSGTTNPPSRSYPCIAPVGAGAGAGAGGDAGGDHG